MDRKVAITLACLLAGPFVTELGFRLFERPLGVDAKELHDFRRILLDGTLPQYEPRAHVVFARPRNVPRYNSEGFSDVEWTVARTPGVPRILCVGASTTEGGNPEGREARYPTQLERLLERRTGRDFEVMSAGVAGWTTAEMLVSWFLTLQDYAPDVVVLHEAIADVHPRLRKDFRPDYSHWRIPLTPPPTNSLTRVLARWSDLYLYRRLRRDGVPDIAGLTTSVPRGTDPLTREGRLSAETARPFVRNLDSIGSSARAQGATVVLMSLPTKPHHDPLQAFWDYGVAENNRNMGTLAAEKGYVFVDAAAYFAEHAELVNPQFRDYVHLTGKGNQIKAELVADALEREWLPKLSPDGARPPR